MTNAIPNVSRELLERASNLAFQTQHYPLHEELRTILSAPSPAGVDGLEVEDDYSELRMLAEKATPGPWWIDSHGHRMVSQADDVTPIFQAVDLIKPAVRHPETGNLSHWPNDWDASYIATANPKNVLALLDSLSDAQAIIDGLRDQLHAAHEKVGRYADQRDQQAQRIGELEGLLRAESARVDFLDAYIVTADAPDTGKSAMLADSGTLRECIDAALSSGKEWE